MEKLFRKVKELELEVEKLKKICTSRNGMTSSSESRRLQLKFSNKLSLPVLTGSKIKGEGCTSIEVALVDTLTGQVVKSGPEATANVEIVVLEGDFGRVEDNWTVQEFNNKIIRERKGISILAGNTYLNLIEGIGSLCGISFTHSSIWMKNWELCLGARVVDNFPGTTIKTAKTEPFILKDCRNTLYKKHYPPSLSDEVWRLEKIGRNGTLFKSLSAEHINTVKDFLTLLFVNPQRLQDILGAGSKTWEVVTNHARTCRVDKGVHFHQKTGVVFNLVGQLKGLLRESQYVPVDKLSENEKEDAHKSVKFAYEHWDEVIAFDNETSLIEVSSHSSKSSWLESPNGLNYGAPLIINTYDHTQLDTSSCGIFSPIGFVGESSWLDDFSFLEENDTMESNEELSSIPRKSFDGQVFSPDSVFFNFDEDVHLQFVDNASNHQLESHNVISQAEQQTDAEKGMSVRSQGVYRRRWRVLSSVLKLFLIRRRIGAPDGLRVAKKHRVC